MDKKFIVKVAVTINASPARVWEALTNPELIKEYLFGTQVETDWHRGSPIIYKGVWQDRAYLDKGVILKIIPDKLLKTTYWSGMSGLPDIPENYKQVTYRLSVKKDGTLLTLTQDNNSGDEEKVHLKENWTMVLRGLKKLLEK